MSFDTGLALAMALTAAWGVGMTVWVVRSSKKRNRDSAPRCGR